MRLWHTTASAIGSRSLCIQAQHDVLGAIERLSPTSSASMSLMVSYATNSFASSDFGHIIADGSDCLSQVFSHAIRPGDSNLHCTECWTWGQAQRRISAKLALSSPGSVRGKDFGALARWRVRRVMERANSRRLEHALSVNWINNPGCAGDETGVKDLGSQSPRLHLVADAWHSVWSIVSPITLDFPSPVSVIVLHITGRRLWHSKLFRGLLAAYSNLWPWWLRRQWVGSDRLLSSRTCQGLMQPSILICSSRCPLAVEPRFPPCKYHLIGHRDEVSHRRHWAGKAVSLCCPNFKMLLPWDVHL